MGSILKASSVDVLNTIRANASSTYQERIPEATRNNISKVGSAILNYEPARNEFLNALMNRIGYVIVTSKLAKNPLRMFKKGMLDFGDTVEEIFVDIAKAQHYDPKVAESEVFKRVKPNVSALFHKLNRQDFYKVTISNDQLQTAFLSNNGITDLIARITDSLYSGDNYDEFLLTKELIKQTGENGQFSVQPVSAITDEASAKSFVASVKSASDMMEFMSTQFNAANVLTSSSKDEQYLLITPKYNAMIDVEVLASAFNMDKAEFMGHRVLVDNFNCLEDDGVVAVLVDKNYFMIWDVLQKFTEQYNAQGLYWNYFFHHWQILSTSLFGNAVAFTTTTPTVTTLTVEPATVGSYVAGQSYQFYAKVEGTGLTPATSTWTISGNTSDDTFISPQGLLYVAKDETGATITVTATNNFNSEVSGTASVTKA